MYVKAALFLLPLLTACASGRSGWVRPEVRNLYDSMPASNTASLNGFSELSIFSDYMDNSVWVSKEAACVRMAQESKNTFSGPGSLHLTWDKISGGCNWIGLGFGWNSWAPKDMNDVVDSAAIQMQIKSVKGSFSNLPVAFGLEDYAGGQAWYGFNRGLTNGTFNDSSWTAVTIPLKNFPFSANDVDLGKMKQLIIQLEGDGAIYLDNIHIIRYP